MLLYLELTLEKQISQYLTRIYNRIRISYMLA